MLVKILQKISTLHLATGMMLLTFLPGHTAVSEPFNNLAYMGRLLDETGKPEVGPVDLKVAFYATATDESAIANKIFDFPAVSLSKGIFQISIPLLPADTQTIFSGTGDVYVQITDVTHSKVYDRQRYAPTPFALKVPVDSSLAFGNDGKMKVGTVPSLKLKTTSGVVSLKAADNSTADTIYTLPPAPVGGYYLSTDSTGLMSWATPSGAGDITGITAGTGLLGGAESGQATLSVNVGVGPSQIVQLNTASKLQNSVIPDPLPALSAANLTNIPAANITGIFPALSAANLTNIPAANITGVFPALSAANLTNIPAANITGTLPALNGAALTGITTALGSATGTLAIANGGTGSTTQNFVDLSTAQATIAGNKTFTGNTSLSGQTIIPTVALALNSASNDDVAIGNNTIYRVTSSQTTAFKLTGMAGGADGRIVRLINTSTVSMVISNQSTASATAANRIVTSDALETGVEPDGQVEFLYDGTASRWRQIPSPPLSAKAGYEFFDDFMIGVTVANASIGNGNTGWVAQLATGTGVPIVAVAGVENRPGILRLSGATPAFVALAKGATAIAPVILSTNSGIIVIEFAARVAATAGGTLRSGLCRTVNATGTCTSGIYFLLTGGTPNTTAVAETIGAGTTTGSSSQSFVANTFKKYKIIITNNSKADFYIDNVFIETITTNIPTAAMSPAFKYSFVTATANYDIDYYAYRHIFGTTR